MNCTVLLVSCLALGLAPSGTTQDRGLSSPISVSSQPGTAEPRPVGLRRIAGGLEAFGPGYRARVTAEGFSFSPIHASAEPLRFRLEAVERDGGRSLDVGPVKPRSSGHTVRLARQDVVETYELRPDGIEQSFVLEQLPPGRGDLVVRGRVQTASPAPADGTYSRGVRYGDVTSGGTSIGEVIGIDARGARATGSLRVAGEALELVLPAAFVDAAELPLVVDPLFGPWIGVGGNITENANVAFDASAGKYLVVWQVRSGSDSTVVGRFIDVTGSFTPAPIIFKNGGPSPAEFDVVVANVGVRDTFIVVYEDNTNIVARTVDAATGALGPVVDLDPLGGLGGPLGSHVPAVANGLSIAGSPDFGATGGSSAALCAWSSWNSTIGHVEVRVALNVDAAGTLTVTRTRYYGAPPLGTGTPHFFDGTFSASAGQSRAATANQRFLLAGRLSSTPSNVVTGIIVDQQLNPLTGYFTIAAQTPTAEPYLIGQHPVGVDGDGKSWLVAWQQLRPLASDRDLGARIVTFDPAAPGSVRMSQARTIESNPALDESDPFVAWTAESYLVGFSDGVSASALRSVDPFTCEPCEGRWTVPHLDAPSIAAMRHGNAWQGLRALVVHRDQFNMVVTRFFRARDGQMTDLGGGCGQGGRAFATCAVKGNAGFEHRLEGAIPAAPAVMVFAVNAANAVCGSCTLVPRPTVVLNAGTTDGLGNAAIDFPLPNNSNLVGLKFLDQWAVLASAPHCINFDLSNAIQVEIQ